MNYLGEMSVMSYSPEPLDHQGSKIIKKMKSEKEGENAKLVDQVKGMLWKQPLASIKKEMGSRGYDHHTVSSLIRRALYAKNMSGGI